MPVLVSLLRAEEIKTQGKASRPAVLSVVPPPAMSAARGHLLEMQILSLTPDLLNGGSGVGPSNPCHLLVILILGRCTLETKVIQ